MRIDLLMTRLPKPSGPDDTLSEAAQGMWDDDRGGLPVIDECRRVVGMITDREICTAARRYGTSLKDLGVGDMMTRAEINTILATLRDRRRGAIRVTSDLRDCRIAGFDSGG